MSVLKVYNGATWDTAIGKVYDGAVWKEKMWFHDGTAFDNLFPNLVINASNSNCWRESDSGDAYANMEYRNDGTEWMTNTFPARPETPLSVSRGTWLTAGSASDVWVERTIDSGQALDTDAGSGRLNLGTTRRFGNTTIFQGTDNSMVTFRFYNAASGGDLLFTTSSLIVRSVAHNE